MRTVGRLGCCLVLMGRVRRVVLDERAAKASGPSHRGHLEHRIRRERTRSLAVQPALKEGW